MITSRPLRIMAATVSTVLLVMSPMFAATSVFAAQSARTSRISTPPVVNGWVRVSTAAQLEYIDHHQGQYLGRNIELMNNITLPNSPSKSNWTRLGGSNHEFSGAFNGNGHEIYHIQIFNTTYQTVGFIGALEGKVENLNLNVTVLVPINNLGAGVISGNVPGSEVGGLAGFLNSSGSINDSSVSGLVTEVVVGSQSNYSATASFYGGLVGNQGGGVITVCHASDTVAGRKGSFDGGLEGQQYLGSIINSYATGAVNGKNGSNNGGLVGDQGGIIAGSYATGTVNGGAGSENGGLVGIQDGTLSNSYATGAVTGGVGSENGGLVSSQVGTLSNSYATGAVSGGNGQHSMDGGLMAFQAQEGNTSNSYSTGSVKGGAYSGGLVGWWRGGSLTNSFYDFQTAGVSWASGHGLKDKSAAKSTAAMKTERTFSNAPNYTTPWNFNTTWGINPHINKGFPYLTSTLAQ